MFGLMRAKKCGMSADEKQFRRLNYCGTCKTIGSEYSAKARMLLNHDVVFLAELLSLISGDNVREWDRSYQTFNCLSLPKRAIPNSLRFAAAANVILAEFKIKDHIDDGEGFRYRLTGRMLSDEFKKAERNLIESGFPLDELKNLLSTQSIREAVSKSLDDLAFPTARATGIFFADGVRQIGRANIADLAFELGFAFGSLTYLIDAFEDYEKDAKRGRFNALRAVYGLTEKSLPAETRRDITKQLRSLESQIADKIRMMPIGETYKSLFVSRLSQNLARKLKTQLPVLRETSACGIRPRRTFADRCREASFKAKSLARSYSWQMPLVFIFVFAFALVAPAAQTREVRSARECFDLGFNLMFLGAVVGSVLAFPKTLLMNSPEIQEQVVKKAAKGGSWGCGSCGCGDCCDGCCECGRCCDCDC